MLRIPTPLPDDLEQLTHDTIGCCISLHRALGPGLIEGIYSKAICRELKVANIPYERQKRVSVSYRGEFLCDQWLDFVIDGRLVLEIKSVEHLAPVHNAQLLNYMRLAGVRVGLLINFNVLVLRDGIKRKIL
jgi:GxxExxY protein